MSNRAISIQKKVRRSYVVSTLSIALVLFLLGTIGYVLASLSRESAELRSRVGIIIELDDKIEDADSLVSKLAGDPLVREARFVSKEEKWDDEQFKEAFDINLEKSFNANPLPNTIDVYLNEEAKGKEAMEAFIASCREEEGVTRVDYPKDEFEALHSILDTMEIVMVIFGLTLLAVSLLLIHNTVRLAIFSRREVINTLKLVGATRWSILRPFLQNSMWQGLWAGLIATFLFAVTLSLLNSSVPELGISARADIIFRICAATVVSGIVIASLFTYFSVSRLIRMASNKTYLY